MVAQPLTPDAMLATGVSHLLPLQSDSSDDTLAYVGLFFVGLFLVYYGFRKWQQMRLIQDTPTEKVRSAAVGRTELSGTAQPTDEDGTIERPFTDGECLVAKYTVEEWEEDHDHDDHGSDGNWNTIESGTLLTPFELDDDTGRMRVEPEEDATFDISHENQTRFRVRGHQRPPDQVVEFFEREYDGDGDGVLDGLLGGGPDAHDHDDRRYTQEVLPPGEDLYLLGGAEPIDGASGSNADRLVLRRDGGSEEFILSDKSEGELVSQYKWLAPGAIVGGIALSAVMLFLLLG